MLDPLRERKEMRRYASVSYRTSVKIGEKREINKVNKCIIWSGKKGKGPVITKFKVVKC
jgi:hypothetical protein